MIPKRDITRVLEEIDADDVIDLTTRLVRCNSVWDPRAGTGEAEAAHLAAGWARDRGFDVTVENRGSGTAQRHRSLDGRSRNPDPDVRGAYRCGYARAI